MTVDMSVIRHKGIIPKGSPPQLLQIMWVRNLPHSTESKWLIDMNPSTLPGLFQLSCSEKRRAHFTKITGQLHPEA